MMTIYFYGSNREIVAENVKKCYSMIEKYGFNAAMGKIKLYNPQNEKMRVPETKGLKNPQIPKTKRLLFIQTHKRQRKPKQPVSLPFVLYIQFKSNIIFTANQTDSLINVILVNMDITKV